MFNVGDLVEHVRMEGRRYNIVDRFDNYFGDTVYVFRKEGDNSQHPLEFKEFAKYANSDYRKV
jgi:hypothetical protein